MKSEAKSESDKVQLYYPECSIETILNDPDKEQAMERLLNAMCDTMLWDDERTTCFGALGNLNMRLFWDGFRPAIESVETFNTLAQVIWILREAGGVETAAVLEDVVRHFPEGRVPDNLEDVQEALDCMEEADPDLFERFGKRYEHSFFHQENVWVLLHKWVSANTDAFPARDLELMCAQASLYVIAEKMRPEEFWVNDKARQLGCFCILFNGVLTDDLQRAILWLGEALDEALEFMRDLGASRSAACVEEWLANFPGQGRPDNSELETVVEELLVADPEFFSRFGEKLQTCLDEDDVQGRLLKWIPVNPDAFPTASCLEGKDDGEGFTLRYSFDRLTEALAAIQRLSDKVKGKCM